MDSPLVVSRGCLALLPTPRSLHLSRRDLVAGMRGLDGTSSGRGWPTPLLLALQSPTDPGPWTVPHPCQARSLPSLPTWASLACGISATVPLDPSIVGGCGPGPTVPGPGSGPWEGETPLLCLPSPALPLGLHGVPCCCPPHPVSWLSRTTSREGVGSWEGLWAQGGEGSALRAHPSPRPSRAPGRASPLGPAPSSFASGGHLPSPLSPIPAFTPTAASLSCCWTRKEAWAQGRGASEASGTGSLASELVSRRRGGCAAGPGLLGPRWPLLWAPRPVAQGEGRRRLETCDSCLLVIRRCLLEGPPGPLHAPPPAASPRCHQPFLGRDAPTPFPKRSSLCAACLPVGAGCVSLGTMRPGWGQGERSRPGRQSLWMCQNTGSGSAGKLQDSDGSFLGCVTLGKVPDLSESPSSSTGRARGCLLGRVATSCRLPWALVHQPPRRGGAALSTPRRHPLPPPLS